MLVSCDTLGVFEVCILRYHFIEIHLTKDTAMPYNFPVIFIETTIFTKLIGNYLNADEYMGLQQYLFLHPDKGDVIPGTGGVRKLRWSMTGKGKRGGIRIIYYWKKQDNEIWMLTVYGKGEKSVISSNIIKKIAEEIQNA